MRLRNKLIAGSLLYLGATQLYKESVTNTAKNIAKSLGGRILNVGARGIGNYISRTAKIEGSVGCDIAPDNSMDYCDISKNMPYYDNAFDVVFAAHVIEHVKPHEIIQALNEFQRIGKHVIVVIPPPLMPAFYLTRGHKSLIRKIGNTLYVTNNPIYNPDNDSYLIEFNPDAVEVYQ